MLVITNKNLMALLQSLLLFGLTKVRDDSIILQCPFSYPRWTFPIFFFFLFFPDATIRISYALGKLKTSAGRSRECGCWALTIAVLSPPGTGGHQEVGTSPAT